MKNSFKLILLSSVLLSMGACQKSISPNSLETNAAKAATKATAIRPHLLTDSTTLLTSQTWIYYEYFTAYSSSPTNLVWKIGKTNSTLNLSANRVKFNSDGTYSEIDQNGTTITGTWSFINNGTQIEVVNFLGTFISTIEKLTSERYEWLDQGGSAFGINVPLNQAIDTTGGRLSLLTSHTWVYDEYFNNFSSSTTSLVWKIGKSNSTVNYSLIHVKFNTDGTYSETDQFGNPNSGTWTFLNSQTEIQVSSSLGTFTSDIRLLDTERFEWQDVGGGNFGEMVSQ